MSPKLIGFQNHVAGRRLRSGSYGASGIVHSRPPVYPGLIVRGVVTNVYLPGDIDPLYAAAQSRGGVSEVGTPRIKSACCDVRLYTTLPGQHTNLLTRCAILRPRSGIQEGDSWTPRQSSRTRLSDGLPADLSAYVNPEELDGDHVVVGFTDNSFRSKVIIGFLPHPNREKSNSIRTMKNDGLPWSITPQSADARSDLSKMNGVITGVDGDGNNICDASRGYNEARLSQTAYSPRLGTDVEDDPDQVVVDNDTTGGNIFRTVREGSVWRCDCISTIDGELASMIYDNGNLVIIARGQPVLSITRGYPADLVVDNLVTDVDNTPVAKETALQVGDGAVHAVIAQEFTQFWNDGTAGIGVKPTYDAHIHGMTFAQASLIVAAAAAHAAAIIAGNGAAVGAQLIPGVMDVPLVALPAADLDTLKSGQLSFPDNVPPPPPAP